MNGPELIGRSGDNELDERADTDRVGSVTEQMIGVPRGYALQPSEAMASTTEETLP